MKKIFFLSFGALTWALLSHAAPAQLWLQRAAKPEGHHMATNKK